MAGDNGWPLRPLKNCAAWYSGGTPNKATASYWGGNIPWISAKSLTSFFITDSEDRVTDEGARNGTRLVPKDTILFIVRGMSLKSEFRMGITTRPVTFNQDLKALVAFDEVLPAYLAYAIKAKTDEILQLVGEAGHGTGVLPTDRIQALEILLPTLNEQRAIAHILGTLDDKIELNRRMNQTLEAMARALFKSWFVDFDPVRAKAEGRTPSGMDAETARLFPSEFVESELGLIPKGWRVFPLSDVLVLKRGYDLPAANRKPGPVPIISSSGPSGWHEVAMANGPGIVTGRYGTIGQVFWVRNSFWPLNTTLYVKDHKNNELEYCYRVLRGINFHKFSDKAAVPGINRNHIHQELVAAAPIDLQRSFSSIASSWRTLAAERNAESESLMTIRDALLPKLLSGELSIVHAERIVESAT